MPSFTAIHLQRFLRIIKNKYFHIRYQFLHIRNNAISKLPTHTRGGDKIPAVVYARADQSQHIFVARVRKTRWKIGSCKPGGNDVIDSTLDMKQFIDILFLSHEQLQQGQLQKDSSWSCSFWAQSFLLPTANQSSFYPLLLSILSSISLLLLYCGRKECTHMILFDFLLRKNDITRDMNI